MRMIGSRSSSSSSGGGGGGGGGCGSGSSGVTCYRGHWRPAEDNKLRQLVEQFGPQNWNYIAEHFEARSGIINFSLYELLRRRGRRSMEWKFCFPMRVFNIYIYIFFFWVEKHILNYIFDVFNLKFVMI